MQVSHLFCMQGDVSFGIELFRELLTISFLRLSSNRYPSSNNFRNISRSLSSLGCGGWGSFFKYFFRASWFGL